jgi:hypothetical protein
MSAARSGSTYAARHARHAGNRGTWKLLALAGTIACWTGGITVIAHADQLGAENYDYNGQMLDTVGVILILLPLIVAVLWIAVRIAGMAAGEHRRYQAWKGTLPPGQRTAVELAEAAALTAAAIAWHEHNKRADARLTASVMGQPPAAHSLPGSQPEAGDPTAGTQRLIGRYHPGHVQPDGSWSQLGS